MVTLLFSNNLRFIYVYFSLRDKCFPQKPVLIALVCCCLKRAFLWKLGNLQLPRSYRRFKPSQLSVLACRAQGVLVWQTLSCKKTPILNGNLSFGTFDLQTSKTHTTNPTKNYQRLFIHLLFTFSPSPTMTMLKILEIFLALVKAKSLLNTTEILPVTITPFERKAGRKPKFFFQYLTPALPSSSFLLCLLDYANGLLLSAPIFLHFLLLFTQYWTHKLPPSSILCRL